MICKIFLSQLEFYILLEKTIESLPVVAVSVNFRIVESDVRQALELLAGGAMGSEPKP